MGKRPVLIAHRGGNPENTLKAIKISYGYGVDGVELDVRVTKDRKMVLLHDEDLKGVTKGKREEKIWEISWKELQEIEILGGEHIPLLSQALELIRGTGKKTIVKLDLKMGAKSFKEELYSMVEPYAQRGIKFLIHFNKDVGIENMLKLISFWRRKESENILLEVPGEILSSEITNTGRVICFDIDNPRSIPKIPREIVKERMLDIYIARMDEKYLENLFLTLKQYSPTFITINHNFNYLRVKNLLSKIFP